MVPAGQSCPWLRMTSLCRRAFLLTPWLCSSLVWGPSGAPFPHQIWTANSTIPGSVGRSPPTSSTNPHPTPRGPLVCLCHWIWKKAEKWEGRVLSWAEHGRIWEGRVINLPALSLSPSSSSQSQGEEGGEHPEHADQRASAVGRQAGDGERRQARHHRRGMPAAGARRAQQVRGRGSLSVGDPGFQDPFSA